ncbi:MAG TPA: thiosulfate oxidation carrier protein SoxY [Hyphomicrobium sp.]|nr:thiosulfate oxidation carrier protein SoxY [Hyphomicrobium sp.]HRO50361.1 thiosulfate oxidation carrier protein SoxY [Hyphomicrobium sp.]
MRQPPGRVDRRTLLIATFAGAVAGTATVRSALAGGVVSDRAAAALADPAPLTPTSRFETAFADIVGNATLVEGGDLSLELPEEAENGNIVPYRIGVESPMSPDDYVARIHLLSTQNPQARVATFHFTPLSGQAAVQGRMRLAKTQEVVAVAVTSTNIHFVARRLVHVGIGGCGEG